MDFHLTEDQKMIRDAAREFAREVLAPRAAEIDRDGRFPMEEFREAGRRGFAGFLVPEEHGGSAVGNVGMALAMFEINRACASTGVTLSVHNSLVSAPLLLNGTEEQKAKWLPLLASG
ncbi:MAG: acyl-CoA dehydrogenase family protein, partial [Planctomycetes bacterium]|nr:acyl-CoA dehydrogenase family protein [Planctomycetota bacterium]